MKLKVDKLKGLDFLSIKEWNEDERPRERLMKYGAEALSDAELIAIIFGTGTLGKTAIDISRQILAEFGNLLSLAKCDFSEYKKVNGIGNVKAVTLAAVFELSRRIEIPPFSKFLHPNKKTFLMKKFP